MNLVITFVIVFFISILSVFLSFLLHINFLFCYKFYYNYAVSYFALLTSLVRRLLSSSCYPFSGLLVYQLFPYVTRFQLPVCFVTSFCYRILLPDFCFCYPISVIAFVIFLLRCYPISYQFFLHVICHPIFFNPFLVTHFFVIPLFVIRFMSPVFLLTDFVTSLLLLVSCNPFFFCYPLFCHRVLCYPFSCTVLWYGIEQVHLAGRHIFQLQLR